MQKRKNIRLLILLTILVVVTGSTYFLINHDQESVLADPAMFAVADVSEIDSVAIAGAENTISLDFENNDWIVDGQYTADDQRLTVLFAILNQVRARRPISQAQSQYVDSLFEYGGKTVRFYQGDEVVQEFLVAGDEKTGTSYFRNEQGTFIAAIPGYRSYLAGLFYLDRSGWRDKLVFDEVSWNNFEKVSVNFPMEGQYFTIEQQDSFFGIEGSQKSDSLKVLNYIDHISLLRAEGYLENNKVLNDSLSNLPTLVELNLYDIRNRPFTLKIMSNPKGSEYPALKDSTEWLVLSDESVKPVLRDRKYFFKD